MSNRDINVLKNNLNSNRIEITDTISQFMEKCNNNFALIGEWGGGPEGSQGDKGEQGVPTKPKVPIHVWKEGKGEEFQYEDEVSTPDGGFEIPNYSEDLRDVKYQEGHLIILENAHVYILENDGGDSLRPKFLLALHSYNPADVINGKNAYVHIAYANTSDGKDGFVTDDELRGESNIPESVSTYGLRRNTPSTYNNTNVSNMPYMGIYSNDKQTSASNPDRYTWVRIQGPAGPTGLQGEKGDKGDKGDKGEKGDKGDNFTGQSYTIDLDGDISTISLSVDRTRLYNDDYCKCTLHSYYGQNNSKLTLKDVTIDAPYGYVLNGNVVINESTSTPIGVITMTQSGNDVDIKFTPENTFVFPETSIVFPINVHTSLQDTNDKKTYAFNRDTIWTIKGIVSSFELEIIPKYRTIKLFENGEYFPKNLFVDVYKTIDGKRELFELNNSEFTLLYKKYDDNEKSWSTYETTGINVAEASTSCLEFKVVKNYGSTNEEIWDYEDVWVVADGKSSHYYHADLGNTESMMVLTTGNKKIVTTEHGEIECAELRSETGYSIVFDPKFYDGTDELTVTDVSIGSNSGEIYYNDGTFVRNLTSETIEGVTKYVFTVTQVPYGIETIPMTFNVTGKCPVYDKDGNIEKYIDHIDSITFNVYISTITNTYTLVPTVSVFNTSTGETGDTVGCSVYKNNEPIPISDLDQNGLKLQYIVHSGGGENGKLISYSEPLVYGNDDDVDKDKFTASDVAIIFLLEYNGKEIVRSTVPLIKDGIDGEDGNSWQYIFCRSNKFPFDKTGISNPNNWVDNMPEDSNNELLGNNGIADENWFASPKGVSKDFKYEYQAYRKWDRNNKCWGTYGEPTLYSNYSENGSGYSIILSNPIAAIPVGDNNYITDENNENQTDSTLVYLYNNTSNISSNSRVSISLPEDNIYVQKGNFTTNTKNGVHEVIFKPIVGEGSNQSIFDFGSNTPYKLPITLTYDLNKDIDGDDIVDNFTSTINWTLTPIKGIEDVEIFVDKRVVNTSIAEKHSFRVGYYLTSSNSSKKFIGNKDENNINGYKIILTDDIQNLSSGEVSVWENAEYNFVKNGKNRNCYVVLVKSDGKTIVDYINITSINDGKSAIHLELTQDYIAIPCDQSGNIHEKFDGDISSQMILYNGDKVIENNENNISYNFKIGDKDITSDVTLSADGKIHITKDKIKELIHGDTNIECIATYNGSSFHKTIFIDFDVLPYEIEMDKNILTRDVNIDKIIDEYLMVRIKYWDGSQGKWIYTDKGNVILNSVNGQENIPFDLIDNSEKFNRQISIAESSVANNNTDTEFIISYYNEKGEELTYETIGIINTGKNGETPSCKETIILGYSTENIDVDSTEWKATLDELGTLSPGQPIYILNEYTWNNDDETTSRGITVTLAGTQGVDGKSRVLFYLGSFQDGTLKGEKVEGKLDDERCDYYIDSNGDAWMRTGLNESADGYPTGSSLDSTNWKPSTKVGFLQSGAITADMINAGSITAESAIVSKLFSEEITATKLKVTDANIEGTLSADKIAVNTITVDKIDASSITADSAIVSKLFSEEITANNLKVSNANISEKLTADKIDVTNLSINTLNTKPDNNQDKIFISDNYIYCLDGDSKRNLKISSDNINMNCLDALFTPISEDNSNTYSNVPSWTSRGTGAYGGVNYINTKSVTSGQGTLSVSDDATIDDINANGKCTSIGYLFANTNISITLKVALCLLNTYWGNETTTYKPVSGIYWNIIKGSAPGWGLTQTGGVSNTTNTGGYLLVYKLNNENGIYEPYKQYSLSGTWKTTGDVSIGGMTINNSGNYKVKEVENINIDSDGMYGIEVVFEPYSITYEKTSATSVAPRDMYINARFTINTDLPNQYTEIGKNGLISFNEDNAIALDSNGVIMKSKNCENGTYNFYGLKVNKSGIYIGNNSTDWKKLNLDKMIELGIVEDITAE